MDPLKSESKPNLKPRKLILWVFGIGIVAVLVEISIIGGLIYAAAHFIAKFW